MSDSSAARKPEASTVVMVEDHGLLAHSLAASLRAEGLVVERCDDMTEDGILSVIEQADPEVVLLDLDIGGELETTLPLIRPLTDDGRRVVMLTGVTNDVRLAECVEAGAVGIILKSAPFDDLIAAVQRVTRTGALLSPSQREEHLALLRRHRQADQQRLRDFEQLTPREEQVLAALMDGRSAEQIATDWVVSIATVRSQIRSLLQKLDVNSQLAAVALARQAGWAPTAR